jgi:hypothetical protein
MDDLVQAGIEAKRREVVLRETRSLLRRADELKTTVGGIDDDLAAQLIARVAEDVEKLVRHLVQADRRLQRRTEPRR